MIISPNMALKIWNQISDPYDHAQLAENWSKVDEHDHTSGKGKSITTGAIADGAITQSKIAAGVSLPLTTIPPGTITTTELADGGVATADLADGSVTNLKLGSGAVGPANVQASTIGTSNFVVLPQVRVAADGTQSASNTTIATVNFSSTQYDLGTVTAQHDNVTNNSRLTCRVAGLYTIFGWVKFNANATIAMRVRLNGATDITRTAAYSDDPVGFDNAQAISTDYRLGVGDFLTVEVGQDDGGTRTIQIAEFGMTWRSP